MTNHSLQENSPSAPNGSSPEHKLENLQSQVLNENEDVESVDQSSLLPKEDLFAWLQVLGAFVLNLNTWLVPSQN